MFVANVTVKLQTSTGIDTLQSGEVFKSRDPQLKTLVDHGIISHYCYWLETAVEHCPVTCIDRHSNCPHWEEWLEIRFPSDSASHNKGK